MEKIKLLPKWILPDTLPSVYDTTSGTAVEMVAKVYGAMRNLQEEYNSFVDEINNTITEFIETTNLNQQSFEEKITKIMHDYIIKIDEKIKLQDLTISTAIKNQNAIITDAVNYMKEKIVETTTNLLNSLVENGEITVTANYDEVNEKLSFVFGGVE